jgi:hypothetical protein
VQLFEAPFAAAIKCKVFPVIVKQIYNQNYYYLNTLVFHEVLENVELCNAIGGILIKNADSYLTSWYLSYDKAYVEAISSAEFVLHYFYYYYYYSFDF